MRLASDSINISTLSSVFNLSLFSCSSLATTTTRVYISPKCTPHLNSQVSVITTGVERKAIFSIFDIRVRRSHFIVIIMS